MAGENVIEVLIVGVDKLSPEAQRAIATLRGLSGATSVVTGEATKATAATKKFHGGLSPLRSLLIQTTGATGGLGAALFNIVRFGFTPVGIAIASAIALTTALVRGWQQATKDTEEFKKAIDDSQKSLALMNAEYRAIGQPRGQVSVSRAQIIATRAPEIQALRDEIERRRSIARPLGMGPQNIVEEGARRAFGLSTEKKEAELAVKEAQFFAELRGAGKAFDKKAIEDITQALKKQGIELEAQARLFGQDKDAIEEYVKMAQFMNEVEQAGIGIRTRAGQGLTDLIVINLAHTRIFKEKAFAQKEDVKLVQMEIDVAKAAAEQDAELGKARVEGMKQVIDLEREAAVVGRTESEKRIVQIKREMEETREALETMARQFPEIAEQIKKTLGDLSLITGERIRDVLEPEARNAARTFIDRFISTMEEGKFDLSSLMKGIGRTIALDFMEEMLTQALLSSGFITGGRSLGAAGALGLLGLFGLGSRGGFPNLGPFAFTGGEVAGKGGVLSGNFMPVGTLRKFQTGGVARGPTLGVIGEEGPEIVARMKPGRSEDFGGNVSVIIQGDVTPRPGIKPQDVILIVADDMERGGKTARASINLQKRR